MAAKAWCAARAARARGAKPECPLDSEPLWLRVPLRSRIGLVDLQRRIGLVFWLQRPRFWTRQREEKALGLEKVLAPSRGSKRVGGGWGTTPGSPAPGKGGYCSAKPGGDDAPSPPANRMKRLRCLPLPQRAPPSIAQSEWNPT